MQTSQGYIIRILQHFATKLRNSTNFAMLFQAVVKFSGCPGLSRSKFHLKGERSIEHRCVDPKKRIKNIVTNIKVRSDLSQSLTLIYHFTFPKERCKMISCSGCDVQMCKMISSQNPAKEEGLSFKVV